MPTIPNTIYQIHGELKWNVASTQPATWKGAPVTRVNFKNKEGIKSLNYNPKDVVELPYYTSEDGHFRFRDQNGRFSLAVKLHYYGGSKKVVAAESRNGYLSFGFVRDLVPESSLLDSPFRNVFDYLCALSDSSKMENEDGHITSLRDRYNSVRAVFSGSLLYPYCKPNSFRDIQGKAAPLLIFPFGCNASQFQAVSSAMSSRLSIIEGPPGTGKTQTILNIIANMLVTGKSILVVSNNNTAVENVVEKLSRPQYGMGWLVATLGRKDNIEAFLSGQTGSYPDLSSWETPDESWLNKLRGRLMENTSMIPGYFENQQRLSVLQEKLEGITFQSELYNSATHSVAPKILGLIKLTSTRLYSLLVRMDDEMRSRGRLQLVTRLTASLYGFKGDNLSRDAVEAVARRLELTEIEDEIKALKTKNASFKPYYDSLVEDSLTYLRAEVKKRYGKSGKERRVFSREDMLSIGAQAFIQEYPVVTSTNYSATSCIDQAIPFDCVIMDEASQADVATGALALNAATSAVIVGDPKQLPNVVSREVADYVDDIFTKSGLQDAYRFTNNSFLDSILSLFPSAPVTLLKEHYRCAPEIIGYCNLQFYGGELVIMTSRKDGPVPISCFRTVKGNHARERTNEREVEVVVECVRELVKEYKDIGVIAPYDNQVKLISERLVEAGIEGVTVATVHKFQGREKDAIVLSTTSNRATDFVDDPHLLNVAVSRAKERFILVTTGNDIDDGNIKALVDYIGYCGGSVRESGIRSVFDLLYAQYAEERAAFVASHTAVSQYATENFIFELLKKITAEPKYNRLGIMFQYPLKLLVSNEELLTEVEKLYASRSWTLVDFLLFNKVTKDPVLVIEVDGMSFHKEGSEQWERDRKKDSILEKSGVPLLRLLTTMSREEKRIKQALDGLET